VVDDEPNLRRALLRVMRAEGLECREAENGREALNTLAEWPAELVLTDLNMPVLDGRALLSAMREYHADTAVVLITAVADVGTAVTCLAEGAMDYLTKPFNVNEVRARVRQVLERRRLVMDNREYQSSLERRVGDQAARIEQLFLSGVQALVDALEVKDAYTLGHSLRVSACSVAIARTMGLPEEFQRQVELGGRVHDIGKIGVREAVLRKPGALTDDEYRHVMTHTTVGWRIMSPLLGDHPAALDLVRSHHERMDGTGSPDGLVGEAIPLSARICAVADTFDAMTSARPYRPALPVGRALDELRACRGTQFDSQCADAFLDAVSAGLLERVTSDVEGSLAFVLR
jgi:response regulator RpfG family c-di-GMP phosphodiesterase